MKQLLAYTATLILLTGCSGPSQEDYDALMAENQALKQQLEDANQRLKATHNQLRHKIFTQIRRINRELKAAVLNFPRLQEYSQELQVLIDSYTGLSPKQDHVSHTSSFYARTLNDIIEINSRGDSLFNHTYNNCVRNYGVDPSRENTMVCEVKADIALNQTKIRMTTTINGLLEISEEQIEKGRQTDSSTITAGELSHRLNKMVKKATDQ